MNICCNMFYDDKIENYGKINYEINKKYCEKYGFDIILSNSKTYTNRHSAWEKLPLLLSNISNYDYLVWIDADAYFYKDAKSIVDFININPNANFIFSNDISGKNINSGIFIIKNTQYSIDFLNKWAYDEELYVKFSFPPIWWEQAVLFHMFYQNILNIQENCILLDYGVLQHFYENDKNDKTLVHHLAGRLDNDIRYNTSKKYFNDSFYTEANIKDDK